MKVFLVSDYFYPFTPGGSEWSVYELAKSLKRKKINPVVVSLNYGARGNEIFMGIEVIRLPFFKKLSNSRKVVNPFWQNNPIFLLTSSLNMFKSIKKENPSIIHVNGKFLIPASIIAGFLLRKPVVVTIRDKQLLCPIGKCFFEKNRLKACTLREYLLSDIPWFFKNYHQNQNLFKFVYIFLGSIWARFAMGILKFFAKHADAIIAISNSQKEYLEKNGFKKVKVIYNTGDFRLPLSNVQNEKRIIFAGKLSKGKGGEVLLAVVESIIKEEKIKFLFAGSVDLKDQVEEKSKNTLFKKATQFLGPVGYEDLANLIKNSSAVIMPSIYPEAFGRVALEALCAGVPAVVSNTGGLPEIVKDKVTGRVVNVEIEPLKKAILDVVTNESKYKNNIRRNYKKLEDKFYEGPIGLYVKLYKSLPK